MQVIEFFFVLTVEVEDNFINRWGFFSPFFLFLLHSKHEKFTCNFTHCIFPCPYFYISRKKLLSYRTVCNFLLSAVVVLLVSLSQLLAFSFQLRVLNQHTERWLRFGIPNHWQKL